MAAHQTRNHCGCSAIPGVYSIKFYTESARPEVEILILFRLSVVKPKSKSLWPITVEIDNPVNKCNLETNGTIGRVFLLIG